MPTEKREDTNALHLISDILDRLIDSQQATSESNVGLKQSVDIAIKVLSEIQGHFTNGFRSEIKEHINTVILKQTCTITDRIDTVAKKAEHNAANIDTANIKIQEIANSLTKPWFWMKTVAAMIVGLGAIAAVLAKLLQ